MPRPRPNSALFAGPWQHLPRESKEPGDGIPPLSPPCPRSGLQPPADSLGKPPFLCLCPQPGNPQPSNQLEKLRNVVLMM